MLNIRGTLVIATTPGSGAGDPVLARDTSSGEIGTATALTSSLNDGQILVGNGSNVATAVTPSGDVTISNTGVTAIGAGVIVNADIHATAAIAVNKLAALTVSRALVSDGSGFLSTATTTATEIGYVNGVTSAIQTQLNAKQATITGAASTVVSANLTSNRATISNGSGKLDVSATTSTELGYVSGVTSAIQTQLDARLPVTLASVATGDIIYYDGAAWVNLARGTNGQTLQSTAGSIAWGTPTINGIPIAGTLNQVLAKQSGTDYDADWETLTLAFIPEITATASELNILDGATLTTTELNYVDGVTSSIQNQLDAKQSSTLPQNSIWVGNGSNLATALSAGTNGYVLTITSGVPTWEPAAAAGTPPGANTQVIFNDAGAFGADSVFTWDKTNNRLGAGTTTPDRTLHAEIDSATTNAVTQALRITSTSSGSPANGIGVGMEFEVETTAGNEIGATIEAVTLDVTSGSEDFALVFKTMSAGAAATENLRLYSDSSVNYLKVPEFTSIGDGTTNIFFTLSTDDLYLGGNTTNFIDIMGDSNRIEYVSPQHLVRATTSATNTTAGLQIRHETSGTPATGIGTLVSFITETSAGNNEIGGIVETISTDVTGASEDFDFSFKLMAGGTNATEKLRITSDGRLYGTALHNNSGAVTGTTNQYVASGTYTPTVTNGTNVAASTPSACQWLRVGNVVTVSGTVAIDPTAATTATNWTLSLPIASDLASVGQLAGSGTRGVTVANLSPVMISGDPTNNTAYFDMYPPETNNGAIYFTFTYVVL